MILISQTKLNSSFPISQSEIEDDTKNMLNWNAKVEMYTILQQGIYAFHTAE